MEQVSDKVSAKLRAKYKENHGAIKALTISLGISLTTVAKFKNHFVVEKAIPFLENWKAQKAAERRAQEIESEKRFLNQI